MGPSRTCKRATEKFAKKRIVQGRMQCLYGCFSDSAPWHVHITRAQNKTGHVAGCESVSRAECLRV
jgi:hypothetical protein